MNNRGEKLDAGVNVEYLYRVKAEVMHRPIILF